MFFEYSAVRRLYREQREQQNEYFYRQHGGVLDNALPDLYPECFGQDAVAHYHQEQRVHEHVADEVYRELGADYAQHRRSLSSAWGAAVSSAF